MPPIGIESKYMLTQPTPSANAKLDLDIPVMVGLGRAKHSLGKGLSDSRVPTIVRSRVKGADDLSG